MNIDNLSEIKTVYVHWSESSVISEYMGCDECGDIEKNINPVEFDNLIKMAGKKVGGGFDKTVLTIELVSGETWVSDCKFYLKQGYNGLIELINS